VALSLRDATFAVVDVETTGVDPAVDRVVEVACVLMRIDRELDTFSTLIDPGRPIPAIASAIHHITDRHVRGAPSLAEVQPQIDARCAGSIVVAHNARFDLGFLPFLAHRPMLCSMRLAMRVLPDAPNFKNQVLRYHLDVDATLNEGAIAHRALGDAQVTGRILSILLQRHLAAGGTDDAEQLVREVAAPRRLAALPFGRHRGVAIESVPADYLRWLDRESLSASRDARFTARRELERRAMAS
jgi:DNA polymerase III epsilon subunit-like protein